MKSIIFPCFCLAWMGEKSFAQTDSANMAHFFKNAYYKKDSNMIALYYSKQGACKSYSLDSILFPDPKMIEVAVVTEIINYTSSLAQPQIPFLQFHGNIAYTFDYRSQLDTPFAASNLQQHNEQTYVDATLKGRYPFRIVANSRQSNSPYFRNYTDVNIEFNHQAFRQGIKDVMIADMIKKAKALDSTDKYEKWMKNQKTNYFALKNWIANPARTQEIVEEKEQLYKQVLLLTEQETKIAGLKDSIGTLVSYPGKPVVTQIPGYGIPLSKDSLMSQIARKKDSLLARMLQPGETEKRIREKQKLADSLYKEIVAAQHLVDSFKAKEDSRIKEYANKIRNARSIGELEDLQKKADINSLGKTDKTLLAVTHFGIGRSSVNYSDLTVNNISLLGLNIEYNPSYYAAFAAGSVDYLFRDFVVQPGHMPRQNLVLGRFGWGDKEKRIFTFTAYSGTKNSFGGNASGTLPSNPMGNSMHIFGYSLEAKYRLDPNTDFSFEAAKSSSPYTAGSDRNKSFDHAFIFSDHNNEALSAKFNMSIPATRSSLNVFYKKIGANFQSYSVFNYGNRQEGWGVKWRQYLFKDRLSITLQIKKSYFDNPLVISTYSSSMIFKSAQVVFRKKKWPVFSAGYMPSTQLIKNSNGYLSENVYYTLTAGVFYNYTFLKLHMNSSLMYCQFFNQGTDSGFIHYNARNILYTHNMDLGKLHSQSDVQYTQQPGLLYWMFQQRMDLMIGKYLTVGSSLKNDLLPNSGVSYWGGSLQINIQVKSIGGLRAQYNKDFLPNGSGGIVPNNWGRAVWTKVF